MDLHLVNQAGLQVLLGDIGAASQNNVPACGSVPRSLQRYVDSFGDKVEGGLSLHRERFAGVMSQDEDGRVKWWILSPPAVPGIVSPSAITTAEHVAAHDGCPDVLEMPSDDVVVRTGPVAPRSIPWIARKLRTANIHLWSSSPPSPSGCAALGLGPATQPSSDIVISSLIFCMVFLLGFRGLCCCYPNRGQVRQAELLEKGGHQIWAEFMSDLLETHLV